MLKPQKTSNSERTSVHIPFFSSNYLNELNWKQT